MAKLTKNLAPLFDSSISYEPGERFMYGDHMYEALEPLSGAFDSTKVSEVTLADIFKGVSSNDVKCLAPEYDVNTEYSVENLVLHDGVLYECVEATTGPFDETKWSRKYLSDVGGLNSNLMNLSVLSSGANRYTKAYTEVAFTIDTDISSGILVVATGNASNNSELNGITLTSGTSEEIHSNEFNDSSKTVAVCITKMYKVKNIEAGTTLTVNGVALFNALYTILG